MRTLQFHLFAHENMKKTPSKVGYFNSKIAEFSVLPKTV